MKNKKASVIVLIASIGLIILGLNQIFELFDFLSSKTTSLLIILLSLLNFIFIFIFKLNNVKEVKH